jgi:hypothetical protein
MNKSDVLKVLLLAHTFKQEFLSRLFLSQHYRFRKEKQSAKLSQLKKYGLWKVDSISYLYVKTVHIDKGNYF